MLTEYPYVPARHQGGRRSRTQFIVIHTMEAPKTPGRAEDTARYFAASSPVGSAHFCVDNNSVVQCVDEHNVANHAAGANSISAGIEHAGYARQSGPEWEDGYNVPMLRNQSAPLMAKLLREFGLPNRYVEAVGLRRGDRGWTTHWQVTVAFKGSKGHWDPGPNFPFSRYAAYVQAAMGGVPPGPQPEPPTPVPPPPPGGGDLMFWIGSTDGKWHLFGPKFTQQISSQSALRYASMGMMHLVDQDPLVVIAAMKDCGTWVDPKAAKK